MRLALRHAVQVDAAFDRQPALGELVARRLVEGMRPGCRLRAGRSAGAAAPVRRRRQQRFQALGRRLAARPPAAAACPSAAAPCAPPGPEDAVLVAELAACAWSSGLPSGQPARHQRIEIRRVAHHAGDLAGRIARSGEEVAARRPGDRRAGVLRDHQPAERLSVECRQRRRVDVRTACRMCAAAGRPRSSGQASAALSPRRSGPSAGRRPAPRGRRCRSGSARGSRRCGRDCSRNQRADRLHRHLGERDFAELGQNPAGAGEALAGLRRIGDAAQSCRRSSAAAPRPAHG